jgi:CHAT domain-containing protein
VTLWPVPDKGAALFTIDFMRRVRAGKTAATALAETRRAFATSTDRRRAEVRLWSAFVLHGT